MSDSISVICDRCRAEGLAGEDPFEAFGALLDFEPVPRKTNRADGWDAQLQRAYIAILSLCGSEGRAARAVGRSPFGVTQLLRAEGNEGFVAASEAAKAMAADERGRRLAEAVRVVAAEGSGWKAPAPPWSGAASRRLAPSEEAPAAEAGELSPEAEQVRSRLLDIVVRKYLIKLAEERRCRLEGRIAEADFYLRQVTVLEISLDLLAGDGMAILKELRRDGHDLLHIAETPLSRLLDEARRRHWQSQDEPPRPEPPRHLFVDADGCTVEPLECFAPGDFAAINAQHRAFDERYARDAEAQVEWEAKARRDYEERRERDAREAPSSCGGEGKAPPGAEGEGPPPPSDGEPAP